MYIPLGGPVCGLGGRDKLDKQRLNGQVPRVPEGVRVGGGDGGA